MEELKDAGVGVAAISYDSEKTLAAFAERRSITFPLLSDDDSAVIKDYGILNTVVAEGLGPNADDPAVVADVHRYVAAAVFDSPQLRRMINGTPFPGTFMLDSEGRRPVRAVRMDGTDRRYTHQTCEWGRQWRRRDTTTSPHRMA